eukprot:SAG11_NODE_14218_length_621_cov_0.565134_1_plen_92_part_00
MLERGVDELQETFASFNEQAIMRQRTPLFDVSELASFHPFDVIYKTGFILKVRYIQPPPVVGVFGRRLFARGAFGLRVCCDVSREGGSVLF